jgi:THO complex subunit 2
VFTLPIKFFSLRNYTGRFLVGILKDLWKWHQDEELYKQENRAKSGGKTVTLPGMQMKWSNKTTIAPEDIISWPSLKQVMKKWHRKLGKVIVFNLYAAWVT